MTPRIIEDFRKDTAWPAGHGYGRMSGGRWVGGRPSTLSSEIVHSTSNSRPTTIQGEAGFLRNSRDVSCHDLIAKNGDVYIILPEELLAWHAGVVRSGFDNLLSFGTELHISVGEKPTAAQIESLTYRLQERRQKYGITKEHIDTHRAVALPKGRKSDPQGWADVDFYKWRDSLFVAPVPPDPGLPPGTVPVDPKLQAYYDRSGGLWQPDRYALGYAITPLDPATRVQKFERGALRLNADGSIDALLRSEW